MKSRTVKAWAIVRKGRISRHRTLGREGLEMLAIYSTRTSARYYRCRNNGERIVKVTVAIQR